MRGLEFNRVNVKAQAVVSQSNVDHHPKTAQARGVIPSSCLAREAVHYLFHTSGASS